MRTHCKVGFLAVICFFTIGCMGLRETAREKTYPKNHPNPADPHLKLMVTTTAKVLVEYEEWHGSDPKRRTRRFWLENSQERIIKGKPPNFLFGVSLDRMRQLPLYHRPKQDRRSSPPDEKYHAVYWIGTREFSIFTEGVEHGPFCLPVYGGSFHQKVDMGAATLMDVVISSALLPFAGSKAN